MLPLSARLSYEDGGRKVLRMIDMCLLSDKVSILKENYLHPYRRQNLKSLILHNEKCYSKAVFLDRNHFSDFWV